MHTTLLVTGGAGFIGSTFVRKWLRSPGNKVINLDLLTYAGNLANLNEVANHPGHIFVHGSINDRELVRRLLTDHQPSAIAHFAAESHVDRSILGPEAFLHTNVLGTFCLLEEARAFWQHLAGAQRESFRFLHVSTDEVYGSLQPDEAPFHEERAYAPNSPYSASKAGSDHLVRAYHHTYGLPVLTTNCSNNYGPFQFPEKLIPLTILNALAWKLLPVYGDGKNMRDWLHVEDHCDAIALVLEHGRTGETYNIGGCNELQNIDVVRTICRVLDDVVPPTDARKRDGLITFVKDRPGHDRRYAIDIRKIRTELGWSPQKTFESGIRHTIDWYLDNRQWCDDVTSGAYQHWIEKQYSQRS